MFYHLTSCLYVLVSYVYGAQPFVSAVVLLKFFINKIGYFKHLIYSQNSWLSVFFTLLALKMIVLLYCFHTFSRHVTLASCFDAFSRVPATKEQAINWFITIVNLIYAAVRGSSHRTCLIPHETTTELIQRGILCNFFCTFEFC